METEKQLSETAKPRPSMSLLKFLGWGVLILTVLTVIALMWNRGRMASRLQGTLVELDRTEPGWRAEEIEVAREDVPEEDNSARVVVAAAQRLPQRWPTKDFPEEHYRLLPSNVKLSDADFVRLSRELAGVRPALDVAVKLADMPRGRHRLHYERNPIASLLPDQQESRRIMTLLVYEAMRRNQKGESEDALTACRAALNAARSLGDEPFIVSQLIRIAGVTLSCQAIERTLAQGESPPEEMSALQKLLENEDAFPGLLLAVRGERALFHKAFEAVERGDLSVEELIDSRDDWLQSTAIALWRMDTRQDHALFLSLITRHINDVQQPMPEQAAREKQFEQEVRALPKQAVLTRYLLPAMSKVGEAFRRKHASVRCAIVALAAERYRQEKKKWPDSAEQLCPQNLAEVPLDPFDGKPLRYRRLKDGLVIYSVGPDTVDNGGNLDRERPALPGVDIGFRLWDPDKRRQAPQNKPLDANPR
jgi:hypothetical protein